MGNQNQNGRSAMPGHDRDRDRDRDDDRHAAQRGSAERYGQGQSGYAAGRMGDDRAIMRTENRNQGPGALDDRLQDRQQSTDDRWSGRGGEGYWEDRGDRAYQPPRNPAQGGFGGRSDDRGHGGYNSGYNQQGAGFEGGHRSNDPARTPRYPDQGHGERGHGDPRDGNQSHDGPPTQGLGQAGYGRGDQGALDYRRQGPGAHRGKGPQGFQRSDERIRELVCEALTDDDHVDASGIDVTVQGGEVTLSGNVADRPMKRLAEDCVERIAGVRDVHNQLRIGRGNLPVGAGSKSDTETTAGDKKHRA